MKPPKQYTFFYHWRKCDDRMTVHWKGRCINVYGVSVCGASCREKRNKRQPRLVMHGRSSRIVVRNDRAYIYK